MKDALIKLFRPSFQLSLKNRKETIFLSNSTTNVKNIKLIRLTLYIEWYQNIYSVLASFSNISITKRIRVFGSVLFTKHWSSWIVLALNAFIINIIFASVIFLAKSSFCSNYTMSFFDAFYQSIVTFTSLGFGDIVPNDSLGQVIVMFNVIFGYIVLGLFIFLLSNKITYKY